MIKRSMEELEAENAELRARVRRLEDYLFGKPDDKKAVVQPETVSQRDETMAKKLDELAATIGKALEAIRGAYIVQPVPNPLPAVPCVPYYTQVPPNYPVNPDTWHTFWPTVIPTWTGDPNFDTTKITCDYGRTQRVQ